MEKALCKNIGVTLPEDLINELDKLAQEENRSRSNMLTEILKASVAERKRKSRSRR